ncbi:MAG: hypothetical protein LBD92_07815 [Oscillospiraceae bacterium]|nr:hypothetical protein [Oscillospiraceae bacterium]
MAGFLIGVVTGGAHFWLLSRFTRAVTGGGLTGGAALLGVAQFLLPLAVLLAVAFVRREMLLTAGAGMAAALIGCALARFAVARARKRGEKKDA